MPDRSEHDQFFRHPGYGAAEPRDLPDRLGADRQQSHRGQLLGRTFADRHVRRPGVRVGGRVQRRVFPDAAVGPAHRLHVAGRAVRLLGQLAAQLLADGRHRDPGHRFVVRADPGVHAREPRVAGVPRPRR